MALYPTVHGWLLGDSAYGLKTNLMTPIPFPTTPGQRRYNRAFVKVRKTIECSFGIWKSRWRSMDKNRGFLSYSPEKCGKLLWQLWYCMTFVSTMASILTLIHSMNKFMKLTLPILQEMEY